MNHLEDAIITLRGAVPLDLCDRIVQEFQDCSMWRAAQTGEGLDTSTRNCEVLGISNQLVCDMNPLERSQLDGEIFTVVKNCFNYYHLFYPDLDITSDSGYNLLRYKIGGYYKQHTDLGRGNLAGRTLSCSLALNDSYTGGDFGFFSNEYRVRLEKGDALLFPSNFLYPHQINTVTSGVRYSIVTWGIT